MAKGIFISLIILGFSFCISKPNAYHSWNEFRFHIPEEFRRTGLISSSTYQVYFQVKARDYATAMAIAKKEAVPLTLEYIVMEPFITVRITQNGKQKIRQIIESKGKFVYFRYVDDDVYEAVFQVSDYDLFNKLKTIK